MVSVLRTVHDAVRHAVLRRPAWSGALLRHHRGCRGGGDRDRSARPSPRRGPCAWPVHEGGDAVRGPGAGDGAGDLDPHALIAPPALPLRLCPSGAAPPALSLRPCAPPPHEWGGAASHDRKETFP